MALGVKVYKYICYKCRVCVGPYDADIIYNICWMCNNILNGRPEDTIRDPRED